MSLNKSFKIFFCFLVLLMLSSCACKIVNNLQDVEESIKIGNQLVKNIEKFKNKYGDYPEKLDDLIPEFYEKIPKTKMKEWNIKDNKEDYDKYQYRKYFYYYALNKIKPYMYFNANLKATQFLSLARNTCSKQFILEIDIVIENIFLDEYDGFYKGWRYFPYNNCKNSSEQLKCIFKNQLKCKYQKVEVNSE